MPNEGFEWALDMVKKGYVLTRKKWNGERFIWLKMPNERSRTTEPYLAIRWDLDTGKGWGSYLPTSKDLLASDWELSRQVEKL